MDNREQEALWVLQPAVRDNITQPPGGGGGGVLQPNFGGGVPLRLYISYPEYDRKTQFAYPVYDNVCDFIPLYMTNLKLLYPVSLFLF